MDCCIAFAKPSVVWSVYARFIAMNYSYVWQPSYALYYGSLPLRWWSNDSDYHSKTLLAEGDGEMVLTLLTRQGERCRV